MKLPSTAPEDSDETTDFIVEGTHRLATISLNDYGYLLSARMAQTYLARATLILDSRRSSDRKFLAEIKLLKAMAPAIAREYAQFETFCHERERFGQLETKNWIEWISKWTVQAISTSYCGTVSHLLAYKIRTFHSRVCALLTEK